MRRESMEVRQGRGVLMTNCKTGEGIDELIDILNSEVLLKTPPKEAR